MIFFTVQCTCQQILFSFFKVQMLIRFQLGSFLHGTCIHQVKSIMSKCVFVMQSSTSETFFWAPLCVIGSRYTLLFFSLEGLKILKLKAMCIKILPSDFSIFSFNLTYATDQSVQCFQCFQCSQHRTVPSYSSAILVDEL